jgi:predicted nucleic acid-binding protein
VILPDTSAWIEYDRATGSSIDRRVDELIGSEAPVAVTEPVIAEVAAGARSDRREEELRELLARFELRSLDVAVDFDEAVRLYRRCRASGVTPRNLMDCVIAAVALRNGAELLAYDVDMARIATVVPLALDEASPRI